MSWMSWRLYTDRGQQVWKLVPGEKAEEIPYNKANQNAGDKVWRRQALVDFKPLSISPSLYPSLGLTSFPPSSLASRCVTSNLSALNYYQHLQMHDGHWPGDYGGPMFLMPGALITCHITGVLTTWPTQKREAMIRYILNHQQDDGGWGLHIEAPSTQFGTVMNYVALRILGLPSTHPALTLPRSFILTHGGAYTAPSWCKFWLCVLNVYDWDGFNSVFPEFWLLPDSVPIHPWRWWCHCRMVYLPMAYLFAQKFQAREDELITQLRTELYNEDYAAIPWSKHRNTIASCDLYTPQTRTLKVLNFIANSYERLHSSYLRRRASAFMLSYIEAEDDQTKHICIGPVNKFINMLSIYHAHGSAHPRFIAHVDRVDDYFWLAEDGMKCQGYNGSQLWDTAFATQAIVESGLGPAFGEVVRKAYSYLDISQVQEDVPQRVKFYRHLSNGGWPFSTLDHGWPITDCTAEGMKATLAIHSLNSSLPSPLVKEAITRDRLERAVHCLLTFQNEDGGWATYENHRAGGWLEWINPAEVFSGIMVDYSYCECTSASMTALVAFSRHYPDHRATEIREAVSRGAEFLKKIQRDDGSWYGSWAVCFTYGTWFGVEGLVAAGEGESDSVKRAMKWIVSAQKADGGWGESYESCVLKRYVEHEKSQVVNTAWAVMALIKGGWSGDEGVIDRGVRLLLERQTVEGDWEQEGISGVFNGNCMISYSNYRNIFPMWAIGRYVQRCSERQEKERDRNGKS